MGFFESFISQIINLIKAIILFAPFCALAWIIAPHMPAFNFVALMALWVISFAFGFFIMVISNNDDKDSRRARFLYNIGKLVFLALCSVVIAQLFKTNILSGTLAMCLILPLCLFGAKMFTDTNIGTFLYETFKFPFGDI